MQSQLSGRQFDQASQYLNVVDDFGKWNQGPQSEGAHYLGSEDNPFIDEGIICENCIFWEQSGQCQIVSGRIDPEGLCKLWIIPNESLEV